MTNLCVLEVFWEAQNVKNGKKALDVWQKSPTDKSSFQELSDPPKR